MGKSSFPLVYSTILSLTLFYLVSFNDDDNGELFISSSLCCL